MKRPKFKRPTTGKPRKAGISKKRAAALEARIKAKKGLITGNISKKRRSSTHQNSTSHRRGKGLPIIELSTEDSSCDRNTEEEGSEHGSIPSANGFSPSETVPAPRKSRRLLLLASGKETGGPTDAGEQHFGSISDGSIRSQLSVQHSLLSPEGSKPMASSSKRAQLPEVATNADGITSNSSQTQRNNKRKRDGQSISTALGNEAYGLGTSKRARKDRKTGIGHRGSTMSR